MSGYDVMINPFGTLFNPVSIRSSLARLESGRPFTEDECVQMGAGSTLWCSFSHYTKFARPTREEFLDNANRALAIASDFYRQAALVVLTFGTAFCFRHKERDIVVSNCLKRPAAEFERFRLGVEEIAGLYSDFDKPMVLTVSPIRHMADTAHGNALSKSTLLLSTERIIAQDPSRRRYFPSFEIMMDELRDFSWYAEDSVHPSADAVRLIAERFKSEL